jgi:hypothetical protein
MPALHRATSAQDGHDVALAIDMTAKERSTQC